MRSILPYKPSDYKGELNLLANEKTLISKAYVKAHGDLSKMTKLLEMKRSYLLIAIIRHFNVSSLIFSKVTANHSRRKRVSKP